MRPLENVDPTPEQYKIIRSAPLPYEIIRGAAGSGKTTSAVLKLKYLINYFVENNRAQGIDREVNALVLSFNRTLKGYIEALVMSQNDFPDEAEIEVATFAKWARNSIGSFEIISPKDRRKFVNEHSQHIPLALDFLLDEIEYIQGRFHPDSYDDYLQKVRVGRGRVPVVSNEMKAQIVSEVLGPYNEYKNINGVLDWEDVPVELLSNLQNDYDIIIIDEAQDFTANQLRAVNAALRDEHSLVCVIDTAQRIYARGHTWIECGIDVRGHTGFTLERNYRNTKAIARLSRAIAAPLELDSDGALPDIENCKDEGNCPICLVGRFSKQLNWIFNRLGEVLTDPNVTVGILFRAKKKNKGYELLCSKLADAGILYEEVTQEVKWPKSKAQVVVSTMNSAKGLEFDHVFMPGVAAWHFKKYEADHEQFYRDRKLFAMAVARARKTLTIGYLPKDKPSIVDEVSEELLEKVLV